MRILFVLECAKIGGSITSLMNMLELLKQRGILVDLFVMEHTGVFMERFKQCANVLPEDKLLASAICEQKRVRSYGMWYYIIRCIIYIANRLAGKAILLPYTYQCAAKKLKGYDVVVAYQESAATTFTQYIPAKRRIAWVHTIFERYTVGRTHGELLKMYNRFSDVVCVAEASADAFKKGLPELQDRVLVIPNPLDVDYIITKSKEKAAISLDDTLVNIVSVGRLSKEKQYNLAIQAAYELKQKGCAFKWHIIGEGVERTHLMSLINQLSLQDEVILLGMQANPYPLVAAADVLVITSLYEAQPMVANEALILDVPVITTNYPSAVALIEDEHNGLICEGTTAGIYAAILKFITDTTLQEKLKMGAKQFCYDNKTVIDKTVKVILNK